MINIDQAGGKSRGAEPLLTLASFRRRHGRINFGVLLQHDARSLIPKDAETPNPKDAGTLNPKDAGSLNLKDNGTLNPKPWHDRVLQVGMPLEVLDSEPLT